MTRIEGRPNLISADVHVVEPPEFWQERVPAEFRDRVPRLVHKKDRDEWWIGDKFRSTVSEADSQAGVRVQRSLEKKYGKGQGVTKTFGSLSLEEWDKLEADVKRWEEIRRGAYDPGEMLIDLEVDGVYAGVIYPSRTLTMYRRPTRRPPDMPPFRRRTVTQTFGSRCYSSARFR